jgi:hypothetical protein
MYRSLFVLGLLGAVAGIFFGVKGAITAKHASDSVSRKGGDAKSQFHAARLDKSLNKIRAEIGADGQLLQLNIYPGYIQADASIGSEDKGRSFRIQEDGRVDELPVTLTGPGRLKDNVFDLGKLDTKVVEKLANQAAAKEHLGLDDVSHVVVNIQPDSGKPGIAVYLKNQRFWRAALDGSGLSSPEVEARKVMDDVEAQTAQAAPSQATGTTDLTACITAAGGNTAKLAACTK